MHCWEFFLFPQSRWSPPPWVWSVVVVVELRLNFFRGVLGSQHYWEESTEIFHVSPAPHMCSLIINVPQEKYICYSRWTSLTHHNHSKSIVYIRVYCWCWIYPVSLDKCFHHHSIIQNSFITLKILCIPSDHASLPARPWQPLIFCLQNCAFPIMSYQRRQWQPTPVLLPGKSHGWRSLAGCSP